MAFGAAKSTGRPAVFAVVPGAGVLNTTAALATAYATSTPVLCVTGQVPIYYAHKHGGKPPTPATYIHIDDIELPSQTGGVGSPAQLAEHHELWKTADAAILTLEREVAS